MSFSKRLVVDHLARLQDPVNDSHDDNDREPVDVGGDEEASGPDPHAGLLELARQVGGKIIQVRKVPAHRVQLLFPHGTWGIQCDNSSWYMGCATLYNALYNPWTMGN